MTDQKKLTTREYIEQHQRFLERFEAELAMFSEERRIALEARGLQQFGAPPRPPMNKRH